MAQVIWTEPAQLSFNEIAEYIAFESPTAAERFVRKVITRTRQLARFPRMGSRIPELRKSPFRQLLVPPCRIFYRIRREKVFILFVMRSERLLRKEYLS